MNQTLDQAWAALQAGKKPEQTGGASLQLIESTPAVRVFAAYSLAPAAPGLLVELPSELRNAIRPQLSSRAFSVLTAEFPGLPAGRIGVMTSLTDGAYSDLFRLLCEEVLSAVSVAPTPLEAMSGLQKVIDRWRHFVERRKAPLSQEEVRGLIGEAVILARLIDHVGALAALIQWTGPHNALRDFELSDASLEVKTFQARTGATIRISDPGQLQPEKGRPVFVGVVGLAANASTGRTLPDVIAIIAGRLAGDPGAPELFEEKLAQYGYLPVHASLYNDAYVVGGVDFYEVVPAFPRLVPAMIPPGIDDVEFSIQLSALAAFQVNGLSVTGPPGVLEASKI